MGRPSRTVTLEMSRDLNAPPSLETPRTDRHARPFTIKIDCVSLCARILIQFLPILVDSYNFLPLSFLTYRSSVVFERTVSFKKRVSRRVPPANATNFSQMPGSRGSTALLLHLRYEYLSSQPNWDTPATLSTMWRAPSSVPIVFY